MQFSILNNPLFSNKFKFQIILIFIVNILINKDIFGQITVTYNYTGTSQSWTVPPCVTSITITAAGADGGGAAGGNGAVLSGTLAVTPGQVFQINVGGSGSTGASSGGYNGGGTGNGANSAANQSGGGGGATSISVAPFALANRILVAAGGGGMGGGTTNVAGGNGGCATGVAGNSPFGVGGSGGSQTAGGTGGPPWISSGNAGTAGSLGQGGSGGSDPCYNIAPGGGGGGGYYGGGGGGSDCWSGVPYGGGSGGGGSSLIPSGIGCTSGTNNGPGYLTISYTAAVGNATATNPGPYCVGATIQLNASNGTSYSWTGPNSFTSTLQNPTIPLSSISNAGVYSVVVNNIGCLSTATTTVVINALPIVNAGNDQTVCAGTTTTLNASGATTYSWNNGINNNVSFTQAVGTIIYTVTGTTSGCTNTDQVTVIVNSIPFIDAGQDVSICTGSSATLTAIGATTYSWSPNGQTTASITESPILTSTYTVTGTTLGCTSTDDVQIIILPNALINAGPDVILCEGFSSLLSASGGATYSWDNGIGIGNNVSITPNSTATYTVIGTDALGCIGTDDITITVNPLPTIGAGIDQAVCDGSSVTLSGVGASTYTWDNGVTDAVAFPALATAIYTVTGTDINGCINTDQVLVTVNPIPAVFAGNDVTFCAGQTLNFSGSGAATYTWDNGITNGVAFTPPSGSTTYTVTGTSAAGCINTDQVVSTIVPIPVVSFTPDITTGCVPLIVNFTNTTANSANCVWTISDGTILTGCGTVANTFTQAGCFDITLTTTLTNGCVATLTSLNMICIEALPIAAFSPSTSTINEENSIIQFQNNTINGSTYTWNFGDNSPTSSNENPSHDYTGAEVGNYTVTLIALSPFGCTDTATSIIQLQEDLIYFIPNTFTPDEDAHNPTFQPIFTSGFDPFDFNLLIFNRWGEVIFESHNAEIGWDGTYGSGGELVQDGVYSWKIEFKTTKNDERKIAVGHVNVLK